MGTILTDTETPCYAWSLIPNHVNILLKTGATLGLSLDEKSVNKPIECPLVFPSGPLPVV
ncbi:hypothetical protein DESC_720206 [Desulfosarcina cetonica]|nr:hypothetical protein DESC_720206 [Desulfosarcina cetonica]